MEVLCMIIGEGGWPCVERSKKVLLQNEIVFRLSPVVLLKLMCSYLRFFH